MTSRRVVVAQIGAREHYSVARALAARGRLDTLYADFWAGPLARSLPLRRLAGRWHPDLQTERVVGFNADAVIAQMRAALRPPAGTVAEYRAYLGVGRTFGRRVAARLAREVPPAAFFGYNTGCLEPVRLLAGRGVPTVVNQIDPGRVEADLVRREADRWPGWAARPGAVPDEYYERLGAEWQAATRVVVNSEWSRDALIAQGVPAGKLAVLPLAFDPPPTPPRGPRAGTELTVLWLGQVVLRKGIQYLLEAARLLADAPVRFVIAGPLGITPAAVATAPPNVRFVGPVPRSGTADLYRSADVFVLPTLSDGFAITQIEAMAHGLPVVTTPNCGRVVTDRIDGRVVPAADADGLAEAIRELAVAPGLVEEMGRAARVTVGRYSLAGLADRLESLVGGLTGEGA